MILPMNAQSDRQLGFASKFDFGSIKITQGCMDFGFAQDPLLSFHRFGQPPGGFGFRNAVPTASFQSPVIFNRSGSGPRLVRFAPVALSIAKINASFAADSTVLFLSFIL